MSLPVELFERQHPHAPAVLRLGTHPVGRELVELGWCHGCIAALELSAGICNHLPIFVRRQVCNIAINRLILVLVISNCEFCVARTGGVLCLLGLLQKSSL